MFGALRRLLQSGDIRGVLQESRRSFSDIAAALGTPTNRARQSALDDMNARGGIGDRNGRGGPEGAIDYLRSTGADPAASQKLMNAGFVGEGNYNPAYQSGSFTGYDLPGGGIAFRDQGTGAISTQRFNWGDSSNFPIQAPYEGVRTWNRNMDYFDNPPPFVGRGRPPFPDMPALEQYGYPGLRPSASDPFSVNVPRAFGGIANYNPFR